MFFKRMIITIDVNSNRRTLRRCDAFLPAFLWSQILPFMSMTGLFPWSWDALSDAPNLISRWAVGKKLPQRLLRDSGPEGTSHDRRSTGCCTNVSASLRRRDGGISLMSRDAVMLLTSQRDARQRRRRHHLTGRSATKTRRREAII